MNYTDISPFTAVAALLGFALTVFVGFVVDGWLGALGASLVGATALVVLNAARTRRQGRKFPIQNLEGITPAQAASLLAATPSKAKAERSMPAFKSEVVAEIEDALEATEGQPRAALARIAQLKEQYPRSAAVWSELVRRHVALDNPQDAWNALQRAIVLALDGGMNSLAAKLVTEFPEGRSHLELDASRRNRLERAIEASQA